MSVKMTITEATIGTKRIAIAFCGNDMPCQMVGRFGAPCWGRMAPCSRLNGDICGGRMGRGTDWCEGDVLGSSGPRCEDRSDGTGPVGVGNDGGGMLR